MPAGSGHRLRPLAITVFAPLWAARFAARIFVSMPPRPRLEPAPPAMASSSGVPASACSTSVAVGSCRGSAVNRPRLIGEDNQRVAFYEVRYQRAERVVVAEFDFVGDDGVVFIDDRHATQSQQGKQR